MTHRIIAVIAVSLASIGMLGGATASASSDLRGASGCLRAVEGAQLAWDIAVEARKLPASKTQERERKWRLANEANDACYSVARAICDSGNGFSNPTASDESVSTCAALLDGTLGLKVQVANSTSIGNGVHMATMTIEVDALSLDTSKVKFSVDCDRVGRSSGCSETKPRAIADGVNNIYPLMILDGWHSASKALSCKSQNHTDISPLDLSDLMHGITIPSRFKIDETRLNCTFFMAEPFRVVVETEGVEMAPIEPSAPVVAPEMPDEDFHGGDDLN